MLNVSSIREKVLIVGLSVAFATTNIDFGQVPKSEFPIKNVYIVLDADTRYVRKLADKTISWDKNSNVNEVACLKSELTNSGIFKRVDSELISTGADTHTYNLNLYLDLSAPNTDYKIGKLELIGFRNIDSKAFEAILARKKLRITPLSLKVGFPEFEKQIIEAVTASLGTDANELDGNIPWITLKKNARGELDVTVTPQFHGCDRSAEFERLIEPTTNSEE